MMFFPNEIKTEEKGSVKGYTNRERSYLANNLFGYYNRQYVISSRLSLYWRVNMQFAFYLDKKGNTFTKDTGGVESEDKISEDALWLTANIAPRLAFSYQAIPATLTINGAVIINPLGGTTAIGWQLNRNRIVDNNGNEEITLKNKNTFTGINPVLNIGAAWTIHPHIILESGISINARDTAQPLDNVSIAVVYKR
jgi:hypothetical protein